MAPYTNIPLSPAELSYLHTSLSSTPPIRPDGRSPTQFRPLIAETDILPSTNGSARICFADGTEAVVGVKAEVEKSKSVYSVSGEVAAEGSLGLVTGDGRGDESVDSDEEDGGVGLGLGEDGGKGRGEDEWLELSIEIPGMRDDDALPVFLAAMLREALLAERGLQDRLWINRRFHWRLYIDVCEEEANGRRLC
jgi:exosome complex component RRP42